MNTNALGKRRTLEYAQLLSKTKLPVLLLSATPLLNNENFIDLLLLLDLIRKEKDDLSDKIYDKSNYDERNTKYINQWAKYNNTTKEWEWKTIEKEKEFYEKISGYISYITLKNDPRVYPRINTINLYPALTIFCS
jgi:hypothetical protein